MIEKTKSVELQVKSLEDPKAPIPFEGFANRYQKNGQTIIDKSRETVPSDEWQIDNYLKTPTVLWMHDLNAPIGIAHKVEKRPDGLWTQGEISYVEGDPLNIKVRSLVSQKIVNGLSVKLKPSDYEIHQEQFVILKGVELGEISVVTIPDNQESVLSLSTKYLKDNHINKICCEILKFKGSHQASEIRRRMFEADPNYSYDVLVKRLSDHAKQEPEKVMMVLNGEQEPDRDLLKSLDDLYNLNLAPSDKSIKSAIEENSRLLSLMLDEIKSLKNQIKPIEVHDLGRSSDIIVTPEMESIQKSLEEKLKAFELN